MVASTAMRSRPTCTQWTRTCSPGSAVAQKLTFPSRPSTGMSPPSAPTNRTILDNQEWWKTIVSGEYQQYYEKMYGNR